LCIGESGNTTSSTESLRLKKCTQPLNQSPCYGALEAVVTLLLAPDRLLTVYIFNWID